jgi:hypothetical protein
VSAPVDCDPVMALAPAQAPEAVQEVALLDDQVSVDALPLAIVLGLALKLTVAVGFALTVTVAVCAAVPPAPLQVSVYAEVLVNAPVDWVPVIALAPDQAPEAAHEVAFVEDHVSVALLPLFKALGPTLRVRVGADALTETVADCAALPPVPVQIKV